MTKVVFSNKNNVFYNDLKATVNQYFEANHINPKGDWRLYTKAWVLLTAAIALYVILIWFPVSAGVAIVGCAVLGFVMASIGFNVMHDACHGSFSNNENLNLIMGYTLNILGGNSYIWKQKHNIIHHTYTNVDGVDDDIAKSPVIRQCYSQKWVPAHKLQHLYLPLIYSITSLAWAFIMDFQKYFSGKIFRTTRWKMDAKEHIIFWLGKVYFVIAYMAVPIYVVGFSKWCIGFW
jgi:linoleoyl-CoA desaturase